MKTKGFFAMAMFSMISIGGIAQGLKNEPGHGFTGYTSFVFSSNYEPEMSPTHGNDRTFNLALVHPSESGSRGVSNKMACTDEITAEQVKLIFDKAKEFPEDTEISIALINDGRAFFCGLKRQNNTIINIDIQPSVFELTRELTSAMNESGPIGSGWVKSKVRSGGNLYRHKGVKRGNTLAMAIDINNETGIVILSNVSGFGKKSRNIDTLCFDLLATFSIDNYYQTEFQSNN